jgi:protein-tyrosine phosphatase
MIDIHCHILPGVDDGSLSMDMTVEMLQAAKAAGVHAIVASPHYRDKDLDKHNIIDVYRSVIPYAQRLGIQLYLGYEVHYSMLAYLDLRSVAEWCIGVTSVLLLELNSSQLPANWDCTISDLVRAGYRPVIVHPERYRYIQKHPELATEMRGYGCELQLDAEAFTGPFSFWGAQRQVAEKLLRGHLVDYIASDAHRPINYKDFAMVQKKLAARWPEGGWLNNLNKNINPDASLSHPYMSL